LSLCEQITQVPRWEAVLTIEHEFEVLSLSWLPARDFLIVGGTSLLIWEFRKDLVEEYKALVKRENAAATLINAVQSKHARQEHETERMKKEEKRRASMYRSVWHTQCTSPSAHIACSPDGRYFATAGKHDKVVKVWFARPRRPQTGNKENSVANANGPAKPSENGMTSDVDKDSDDEGKEEVHERSMFGRWK
jgi:WD40 repeat protein